jgi:hypothetical protein
MGYFPIWLLPSLAQISCAQKTMIIPNRAFVAAIALGLTLAVSAQAQVTTAGGYFGRIGNTELLVAVGARNTVAFYYFDYAFQRLDFGTGTLRADGQAGFSVSSGRVVTISGVRDRILSGTYSGVPFTASYDSPFGPASASALPYTGTIVNPAATTGPMVAVLVLGISANGRVAAIFTNDVATHGGLGTISSTGVVRVPITNGSLWNFTFNPSDGIASGLINATVGGFTNLAPLQYVLVEAAGARLINIATRGTVGDGNSLTAGFVINKNAKVLLIRAVGPTLAAFGVGGAQPDPSLTLYSGQTAIATNDDWGTGARPTEIQTAAAQVGAFALLNGSRDSAILVTLEPGAYTAMVSGKAGGAAGDALIEVYEVN